VRAAAWRGVMPGVVWSRSDALLLFDGLVRFGVWLRPPENRDNGLALANSSVLLASPEGLTQRVALGSSCGKHEGDGKARCGVTPKPSRRRSFVFSSDGATVLCLGVQQFIVVALPGCNDLVDVLIRLSLAATVSGFTALPSLILFSSITFG
jgi:hypothetical protein